MKGSGIRFLVGLLAALTLAGCAGSGGGESAEPADGQLQVVSTVFPGYDLARAAGGALANVSLLLPPGAESHSYEPTPRDMLAVGGCDLFIYVGGESDAWVDTLLSSVDGGVRTLKLMDCVPLAEEEALAGMTGSGEGEDDHGHGMLGQVVEYDEHVWTAPQNAAAIARAIGDALAELDAAHGETYRSNAESYAGEIEALDGKFRAFFQTVSAPTLVFGDRFPLRYFADAYGLTCYAAFPGCSTQTEPSAATVAFLTDMVRQEGLSTVYYIEFSNHLVADSIAEAAGAGTALFHSCHNVSQAELDSGVTYLSLMEGNLETLRQTMS